MSNDTSNAIRAAVRKILTEMRGDFCASSTEAGDILARWYCDRIEEALDGRERFVRVTVETWSKIVAERDKYYAIVRRLDAMHRKGAFIPYKSLPMDFFEILVDADAAVNGKPEEYKP